DRHRCHLGGGDDAVRDTNDLSNTRHLPLRKAPQHLRRRVHTEISQVSRIETFTQWPVRRLHCNDEATLEARSEPLLESGELARRTVARQHQLLAVGVQRVEDMEKLFLRPLFSGDELDVVE